MTKHQKFEQISIGGNKNTMNTTLRKFLKAAFWYLMFDALLLGYAGLLPGVQMAGAQQIFNNGNLTQSAFYGNWIDSSLNAIPSGAQTINLTQCYYRATALGVNQGTNPPAGTGQNSFFFPFATNVPVTIVDGANTETVTPSSVSSPVVAAPSSLEPYACSITATFSNAHGIGVLVISGDAGLAEAANDNGKAYGITAGATPIGGACTGVATASSTLFLTGVGVVGTTRTCTQTAATLEYTVTRPGVIKNLAATATAGGVNASSGAITINKNNSASTITCTFGTGTACSDTTHSVTVAVGDSLTVSFTSQVAETLAGVSASFELW